MTPAAPSVDGNPHRCRARTEKTLSGRPRAWPPKGRKGKSPSTPTLWTGGRILHRLSSAVGKGAVGKDVLEHGTDYHEDAKQTGSDLSRRPCVAQALMGNDQRVKDIERRQRVVSLEACAALYTVVGSETWDVCRVARLNVPGFRISDVRVVSYGAFISGPSGYRSVLKV